MADFLRTTNDWDLEAIVRGWGADGGGAVVQLPPPPAPVLGFDWFEFEELEAITTGVANELEELYKPFVGQADQKRKNESPRSRASPCSSSFALFDHEDDAEKLKEMEVKESVDLGVDDHAQPRSSCKRRKSKQKIVRVVHRGVGEDGVITDKWNWRKYGQKAIKGSPYPRSYYRCSSSGGCHARKHVEQSKDDCHTFIVTYIADHSHAPPTRRHAQAGRKITKFSTTTTKVVIPPPPSGSMTWTISDVDHQAADVGGTSTSTTSTGFVESSAGLQVMKDLLSTTSFDHDFNIWELDPFFHYFHLLISLLVS